MTDKPLTNQRFDFGKVCERLVPAKLAKVIIMGLFEGDVFLDDQYEYGIDELTKAVNDTKKLLGVTAQNTIVRGQQELPVAKVVREYNALLGLRDSLVEDNNSLRDQLQRQDDDAERVQEQYQAIGAILVKLSTLLHVGPDELAEQLVDEVRGLQQKAVQAGIVQWKDEEISVDQLLEISKKLDLANAALEDDKGKLTKQLAGAEGDKRSLNDQVAKLQMNLNNINEQVAALKNSNASYQRQLQAANARITEFQQMNLVAPVEDFDAWQYIRDDVQVDQDTYLPTVFDTYHPTDWYTPDDDSNLVPEGDDLALVMELNDYIKGVKHKPINNQEHLDQLAREQYQYLDVSSSGRLNPQFLMNHREYSGLEKYIERLTGIFKGRQVNRKVVILPIPSSNDLDQDWAHFNMVKVISKYLAKYGGDQIEFVDGSTILRRTAPEKSAHEGNGNRNAAAHMQSLAIGDDIKKYADSILLVVDDVVTSGASIEAVDRLILNKFRPDDQPKMWGHIVNFVFGKAAKWHDFIETKQQKNYVHEQPLPLPMTNNLVVQPNGYGSRGSGFIRRIVWDLDNTLIPKYGKPQLYQGLAEILKDDAFKHYVLTNRSLNKLKSDGGVLKVLNNYGFQAEGKHKNIFTGTSNQYVQGGGDFYGSYRWTKSNEGWQKRAFFAKPSMEPVRQLVAKSIRNEFNQLSGPLKSQFFGECIGVGNNASDILSYKKAGMFAVLVRWGNIAQLNNDCGADATFNTVSEFKKWLDNNVVIEGDIPF